MNLDSQITLASGFQLPRFGIGTWRMGEYLSNRHHEVAAIHHALELGVKLIDTAEMYGEGGAEEMIGEALGSRRDQVQIISKVFPHNASYQGVLNACEGSLKRLNTDYIDYYLLHWPGSFPIEDTFDAFRKLKADGKIREFGVSNFDIEQLKVIKPESLAELACNQVFYNLSHRETEWAVSPWCGQYSIPRMAYSPLDQGGSVLRSSAVIEIANNHSATAAQVALAWLLHQPDTIVIPKSIREERVAENYAALELELTTDDLSKLDKAFPGPDQPIRLGMR
jgi:diketogulonate reductase-like aldo/keto reductase